MHHIDTADDPATLGVLISRYELLQWQDKQAQNARESKGNDYESLFDDLLALFVAQQTERSQMLDGLLFSVGTEYASYLYSLEDRQGATHIAETISHHLPHIQWGRNIEINDGRFRMSYDSREQ